MKASRSRPPWVGVDLFFVLSAYLLIALLHKEYAATGTTDFKKFFIRRTLRIWPLFYVYVATCFAHFVATDGEDLTKMAGRTIGHLFLVDNFFSAFAGEYNPLPFTPHLWTIAFEEQITVWVTPFLHFDTIFAAPARGGSRIHTQRERLRGHYRDCRSSCPWLHRFRAAR